MNAGTKRESQARQRRGEDRITCRILTWLCRAPSRPLPVQCSPPRVFSGQALRRGARTAHCRRYQAPGMPQPTAAAHFSSHVLQATGALAACNMRDLATRKVRVPCSGFAPYLELTFSSVYQSLSTRRANVTVAQVGRLEGGGHHSVSSRAA